MSTMVIFGDDVQGLNSMVRAEIYSAPEKKIAKESELRDKIPKNLFVIFPVPDNLSTQKRNLTV